MPSDETKEAYANKKKPLAPFIQSNILSPDQVVAFLYEADAARAIELYSPKHANHVIGSGWKTLFDEDGITYDLEVFLLITGRGPGETIQIEPGSGLWKFIVATAKIETEIRISWPKSPSF